MGDPRLFGRGPQDPLLVSRDGTVARSETFTFGDYTWDIVRAAALIAADRGSYALITTDPAVLVGYLQHDRQRGPAPWLPRVPPPPPIAMTIAIDYHRALTMPGRARRHPGIAIEPPWMPPGHEGEGLFPIDGWHRAMALYQRGGDTMIFCLLTAEAERAVRIRG